MRKKSKHLLQIIFLVFLLLLIASSIVRLIVRKESIMGRKVKPLEAMTIAIDPGHGGIDGGTSHGDILEKDINLDIGLMLRDELLKKGARVIMTREEDHSLEGDIEGGSRHSRDLKARVKAIKDSKADIFISLHVNHIKNSKPMGALVFFNENNEGGGQLAELLQESLNNLTSYREIGIEINRIPLPGDYYILNNTSIPGVLIEAGFISNEHDRELLLDKKHKSELIKIISDSIYIYYKSYD